MALPHGIERRPRYQILPRILLGQRGTIVRRGETGLDFTNKIRAGGDIEFVPASDPPKK
jgi:hypothetical protein